jgi:hypothetical protein
MLVPIQVVSHQIAHTNGIQPLQHAREHVEAPRSSMRASVPTRRYAPCIALASSTYEPSTYLEEVSSDALMEECDV